MLSQGQKIAACEYARNSTPGVALGLERTDKVTASTIRAFEEEMQKNPNSKPEYRTIRRLVQSDLKGVWPIIFATIIGWLVSKMLDYLWDQWTLNLRRQEQECQKHKSFPG